MTNTQSQEPEGLLPVEQVDRDAAANVWRDHIAKLGECIAEKQIRAGNMMDALPLTQAFARHRLSALTPQPNTEGWQPIETAPRDGSDVLLFYSLPEGMNRDWNPAIRIGWFSNRHQSWVWQGRAVAGYSFPPTHWCPSPAPPEAGA